MNKGNNILNSTLEIIFQRILLCDPNRKVNCIYITRTMNTLLLLQENIIKK